MKIDLSKRKPLSPSDAFMTMLGGENSSDINDLPVDSLVPYPKQQTFHQYREEKLIELSESIREQGVLSPIIVRPLPDGDQMKYQILAGHNRTAAAKMAGLTVVPCIIKHVDDQAADKIFVYTNLNQREKLLPSEKAGAYKLLMDQAESDECQVGTAEEIAEQYSESRRQIFRYIRLTYLIKPFMDLLDNDELAFIGGVNLSYLSEKSQWLLYDYVTAEEFKIKLNKSEQLKEAGKNGELDYSTLDRIFKGKQQTDKPKQYAKLPLKEIRFYFGDLSDEEITEKVVEIIKNHFNDNY